MSCWSFANAFCAPLRSLAPRALETACRSCPRGELDCPSCDGMEFGLVEPCVPVTACWSAPKADCAPLRSPFRREFSRPLKSCRRLAQGLLVGETNIWEGMLLIAWALMGGSL